jgi:hypothetical protein
MVGARGFEPPTSWSRTRRATRLRYAPRDVKLASLYSDVKGDYELKPAEISKLPPWNSCHCGRVEKRGQIDAILQHPLFSVLICKRNIMIYKDIFFGNVSSATICWHMNCFHIIATEMN